MQRRELTDFGIMVKKKLVDLGQTQRQLAESIGVGDVYLNVILHGKRAGTKYIRSIADYLDIDIAELKHIGRINK